MSKMHVSMILLAVGLAFSLVNPARGETVVVRSGNGSIGGTDTSINMLVGPADAAFSAAFTPADFAAARTGADAFIINRNPAWLASLPSDASAQWIATNANGAGEGATALYAIDFILIEPFGDATLDLRFAVDNLLGGGPNQGVFLNGTPISGVTTGGGFSGEFSHVRSDIAPLLTLGANTLYINSTDAGGPGGLLFSATITTTAIIPEPGCILLGACSIGLILRRRHARTTSR